MNEFETTSSYIFPLYADNKLDAIESIADFISKKMISMKYTLKTSSDVEEKIDAISDLVMCEAAISLLHLAYTTGNLSFVENSKEIIKS